MNRYGGLVAVVLVLTVLGSAVSAGELSTYRLTDESTIEFGASTPLFAFEGYVRDPEGSLRFSHDPPTVERGTSLSVPVESITTGINARDRDLYELLKTDTYPTITFRADSVARIDSSPGEILHRESGEGRPRTDLSGSDGSRSNSGTSLRAVRVHGTFSIVGGTHRATVPLVYSSDENGLRLQSRFELDVRDFGIEPPSLYVMSVNPTVTIHLDLRMVPGSTLEPSS